MFNLILKHDTQKYNQCIHILWSIRFWYVTMGIVWFYQVRRTVYIMVDKNHGDGDIIMIILLINWFIMINKWW